MTRGASQRLDQQRQQADRRRQERAEARHQNDLDRIAQSGQQRAIRQQRSDYIDTIPGLSPRSRYDLHHSGQARANVGQIKGLDPTHARRLGEYEQALASGSRSVQSFRADRFANRAAEAAVRGQEIQTDYLPTDLRGYMAERAARTANTQSLTAARDADTQRQNAAAPLERDRLGIENEQLRAVTPRVQDGSVLPPRFTNDVRVPRGLNRLDEAKAFDAETRGQLMLQQMEAASRPPRPDYSERVRALQTIVNDEDAGKDEKANARQELAEIAALDQLEDFAASREMNIGEAVAVFEDGLGRRVYQMPDGRYRYDDGREYQDPTQIMDGLGQ